MKLLLGIGYGTGGCKVTAIGEDGSTHNAVLLDGGYRPVRRTIMWTDQRATAECEALKAGWSEKPFGYDFRDGKHALD